MPQTELSEEEREALNELTKAMPRRLPPETTTALMQKGLVEQRLGGFALTSAGRRTARRQ